MRIDTLTVGDYGHLFIAEVDADLSSMTWASFRVRKPDGTAVTWPAALVAPTGGKTIWEIRYTTQPGDIDQAGTWVIVPVVTGTGTSLHGDPVKVFVKQEFAP